MRSTRKDEFENAVFYGDSSTVTWAGPNQHTIISGLVFDSATVVVNQIAMAGSV